MFGILSFLFKDILFKNLFSEAYLLKNDIKIRRSISSHENLSVTQSCNPTWYYCLLTETRGHVNETIFLGSH